MTTFILYGRQKNELTLNEINSYPSLKEAQDGANFSIGSCLDDPTVDLQWAATMPGTWVANFTAPDGEETYTINEAEDDAEIVRLEDTKIYQQLAALSTDTLATVTIPSLREKLDETEEGSEEYQMVADVLIIALQIGLARRQTN